MAAEGTSSNDMPAHEASYLRFAWMMKWGAIASVVTALIVTLIIKN